MSTLREELSRPVIDLSPASVTRVPRTARIVASQTLLKEGARVFGVVVALVGFIAVLVFGSTQPAVASSTLTIEKPQVIVIEVTGLLDRSTANFVSAKIDRAERGGANAERTVAVLLQINSRGGVLSDSDLGALVDRIRNASVPVAAWIGPTNARTYGQATELLDAVDIVGMAPGARIGKPDEGNVIRGIPVEPEAVLSQDEALQNRVAELPSPTLAQFLLDLNGRVLDGKSIQTSVEGTDADGQTVRQESVVPVFTKPSIAARLMHSVNTPGVAEFLLVAGMLLLMFEFLAAGAGVVGVCGAICVWLGLVGAFEVGVRPLGLGLLVLSGVLMLGDLQAGVLRARAILGAFVLGGSLFFLFDRFQPSLLSHVVIWVPSVAFALLGIPVMVRTRFSVGVIDRSPLVGRIGRATLERDGVATVELDGLNWLASSSERIKQDSLVKVSAIDEHVLAVVATTTKS